MNLYKSGGRAAQIFAAADRFSLPSLQVPKVEAFLYDTFYTNNFLLKSEMVEWQNKKAIVILPPILRTQFSGNENYVGKYLQNNNTN